MEQTPLEDMFPRFGLISNQKDWEMGEIDVLINETLVWDL